MEHPHPDKQHVVRQIRRYLLGAKRSLGSARGLIHYRDLVATYLTAKRHLFAVTLVTGLLVCTVAPLWANPTVHQASLTWTQSTGTGLTSNCIYRSQVSGGPYTQLTCTASPATSYVDLSVVGGQTYYYVVTAVAGTQESAFSNEVKAVIPQSPPAPSGLTAVAQ